MERLNLQKLNDVAVKEQYRVEISYRFAALEILFYNDDNYVDNVDINRAWESGRV
jgi:hypothetical protein